MKSDYVINNLVLLTVFTIEMPRHSYYYIIILNLRHMKYHLYAVLIICFKEVHQLVGLGIATTRHLYKKCPLTLYYYNNNE